MTQEEARCYAQAEEWTREIDDVIEVKDSQSNIGLRTYAWEYIRDVLDESHLESDSPWIVRKNLGASFQLDQNGYDWTIADIDDPYSVRTKSTLTSIGLELVGIESGFPCKINFVDTDNGQEPSSVDVYMALKICDEERLNMFLDDLAYQHS